ncbi:thioredoxin [candidate division KSB1 bacterium]|nr:thioredoxin [candidate division KSB1 bacterium]
MAKPIELTDDNFAEQVLAADVPVLVDFWAAWCGPCKMIAPVIEELAKELEGKIKFAKMDVDNHKQAAMEYGIRSIPTLLLFKNGTVAEQIIGVVDKSNLLQKLERHLPESV